ASLPRQSLQQPCLIVKASLRQADSRDLGKGKPELYAKARTAGLGCRMLSHRWRVGRRADARGGYPDRRARPWLGGEVRTPAPRQSGWLCDVTRQSSGAPEAALARDGGGAGRRARDAQ